MTLTDAAVSALVYASGHLPERHLAEGYKRHLMTCPTCSATVKTAEAIIAARLAPALALAEHGPFLTRWIDDSQLVDVSDLRAALGVSAPTGDDAR